MMAILTCLALFSIFLGLSSSSYIPGINASKKWPNSPNLESELRQELFQRYDKFVRPVKNADDTVKAAVSISPIYVEEMDEKRHLIVLETYTKMSWTDEHLTWDSNRFGNITVLRIPATEVWKPDFTIYGAPDSKALFPDPNTNVLVYSNGQVLWVPMFTIKSRCPMVKPFKKVVTCHIQIGSWTYDEPHLDIQLGAEKVDLSDFLDINNEWKLRDIASNRVAKYYPCCKEAYPVIYFNATFERREMETNEILSKDGAY